MTWHLFGTILTHQGVAHNNRGESEGTLSTIQKVIRDGAIHSTVSSEAIRYALRELWQDDPDLLSSDGKKRVLNRLVTHQGSEWKDKEFKSPENYIDNDVLGYMHAKKETASRRGILELSRAVSITPWPGTVSEHFATPGSNPAVSSKDPIPYQAEIHDTRYQYTFAMTPTALLKNRLTRTRKTIEGLQNLRRVAGSHARFLYDFSPEAIALRWTQDPAPRFMFCFEQDDGGHLSIEKLLHRVEGKDIEAGEVVIGTAQTNILGLDQLRSSGVKVLPGVKAAVAEILRQVASEIKD